MESQPSLATQQDLDYLQTQMKNVYATQAEHADRLVRLEQRQEEPSRSKSSWGSHSPFTGLLNGTPQHEPTYNPAAEAFKNFDQDQSSSMMGSLHLDGEEEHRRGASRANSVRFDEKAIHGHFGQYTRSGNESLPSRTGSAFGPHPLAERSLSHKSDGRQSSSHSARHSSIGNDSRPLSATVAPFPASLLPTGPPPGMFYLGPVPSIIRCWMEANYSNDTLLYAAVCSGSYRSMINIGLLERMSLLRGITVSDEGQEVIRLPVYLPEATVQHSSTRSASPAPQLPTITTNFIVQRLRVHHGCIEILLGCDILRLRNADIQLSLDRLVVLDDERNKVSVPLVRPENAALFKNLQTTSCLHLIDSSASSPHLLPRAADQQAVDEATFDPYQAEDHAQQGQDPIDNATTISAAPSLAADPEKDLSNVDRKGERRQDDSTSPMIERGSTPTNTTPTDAPPRPENGSLWGSWRQNPTPASRGNGSLAGATSASGYQRAARGRGMKVLKPARLNVSRGSPSQPVGFDALPSRAGEKAKWANTRRENQSPTIPGERASSHSAEMKTPPSSKAHSSNPVGGASAFGWLNPGSKE